MRTPAKLLAAICIAAPAASSASGIGQPARPASLEGEWIGDCAPIGKNGRHGHIVRIVFRGDRIEGSGQLYTTTDCATPTLPGEYWGSIAHCVSATAASH